MSMTGDEKIDEATLRELAFRLANEAGRDLRDAVGWFALQDGVRSLPTFAEFVAHLQIAAAAKHNGRDALERLAAGWAVAAIRGADETDWQAFWMEVSDRYWRYVTLANLANFHADSSTIDLPDGLRIATRSRSALSTTLGIPEDVLDVTIGQEWLDGLGGYGLFVVAHIEAIPKARLAYVQGAEETWQRLDGGRPMTADHLASVLGRFPGTP
jgi:hypothetical protein